MSEQCTYLPYEQAQKIVSSVMEEEHLHDPDRRILMVYDLRGKEVCWFDADEVLAEVDPAIKNKDEIKAAAVERILHQIPDWALDAAGGV